MAQAVGCSFWVTHRICLRSITLACPAELKPFQVGWHRPQYMHKHTSTELLHQLSSPKDLSQEKCSSVYLSTGMLTQQSQTPSVKFSMLLGTVSTPLQGSRRQNNVPQHHHSHLLLQWCFKYEKGKLAKKEGGIQQHRRSLCLKLSFVTKVHNPLMNLEDTWFQICFVFAFTSK